MTDCESIPTDKKAGIRIRGSNTTPVISEGWLSIFGLLWTGGEGSGSMVPRGRSGRWGARRDANARVLGIRKRPEDGGGEHGPSSRTADGWGELGGGPTHGNVGTHLDVFLDLPNKGPTNNN